MPAAKIFVEALSGKAGADDQCRPLHPRGKRHTPRLAGDVQRFL